VAPLRSAGTGFGGIDFKVPPGTTFSQIRFGDAAPTRRRRRPQ
jgi:hypothetical protein